MEPHVLIRFYHEIALKGANRPWFLRQLSTNLKKALAGTGAIGITRDSMMATLRLKDPDQWVVVKERLQHVIGVERFGRAYRVDPTIKAIKQAVPSMLEGQNPTSFRITARRADKRFPLTSSQINEEIGAQVVELTGWRVDLKNPDFDLQIQTRNNDALLSSEDIRGPGGMPVGVGGHVAMLLSGGIDSPVAAYQMMRRGCKVTFIHFHSFPLVDGTSKEKASDLVELLTQYQQDSRLLMVPFSAVQQQIIITVPPKYRVTIYRRFMLRIAQDLALKYNAGGLVTGESLGQVSSQTLENMTTIGTVADKLPLFRPLLTMDKMEIINKARPLGTYPISIIPDQDCCSLFVPKHPVTKSRVEDVERMEAKLPVEEMVKEALAGVEDQTYHWPASVASHKFAEETRSAEPTT
ncbi:MAG: tRNA uracil 4-sulfurtransferase ThiI [Chloroflexota bacterium]|nr:tRNA uracil 4-sulfurtransferase ThiI [Chloroflexota bacterium]